MERRDNAERVLRAISRLTFFGALGATLYFLTCSNPGRVYLGVRGTLILWCLTNLTGYAATAVSRPWRETVAASAPVLVLTRNVVIAWVVFRVYRWNLRPVLNAIDGGWGVVEALYSMPLLIIVVSFTTMLSGLTAAPNRRRNRLLVSAVSLLAASLLANPSVLSFGSCHWHPSVLTEVDLTLLLHRHRLWLALLALAFSIISLFSSSKHSPRFERGVIGWQVALILTFAVEAAVSRLVLATDGDAHGLITAIAIVSTLGTTTTAFVSARLLARSAIGSRKWGALVTWSLTLSLVAAVPIPVFSSPFKQETDWRDFGVVPARVDGRGNETWLQLSDRYPSFILRRDEQLEVLWRHGSRKVQPGDVFMTNLVRPQILFDREATLSDLQRVLPHLRGSLVVLLYRTASDHDPLSRHLFPSVAAVDGRLHSRRIELVRPTDTGCSTEEFVRSPRCRHRTLPEGGHLLDADSKPLLSSVVAGGSELYLEVEPTLREHEVVASPPDASSRSPRRLLKITPVLCAGLAGLFFGLLPRPPAWRRRRDDQA